MIYILVSRYERDYSGGGGLEQKNSISVHFPISLVKYLFFNFPNIKLIRVSISQNPTNSASDNEFCFK